MSEAASLCRFCMTQLSDSKHNPFETPETLSRNARISSTSLDADDPLPKFICSTCHQTVNDFDDFRQMCIDSHRILLERFTANASIKEEILIKEEQLEVSLDGPIKSESDSEPENETGSEYDPLDDENTLGGESSGEDELPKEAKKENENKKQRKGKTKEDDAGNSNVKSKPGFPFTCEICSRYFLKEFRLEAHMRLHRGLKPFACKFCNKEYKKQTQFTEHMLSEHSENPLRHFCTFDGCDKVYKTKNSLRQHIAKHFQTKPKVKRYHRVEFVCDVCGKILSSKASLEMHRTIHTNIYPAKCEICQRKFRAEYLLNAHKIKQHDASSKYECPICGVKKGGGYELKAHIAIHSDSKTFQCDLCSKWFKSKSSLRSHRQLVHEKIKKYICSYCNQRFGSSLHLKNHVRRHTGEKPFECPICGKKFGRKATCQGHVKLHEKQKRMSRNDEDDAPEINMSLLN